MTTKPGSKKKSGSSRPSVDAGDKDRLIVELKNRVAVLENELSLKREAVTSPGSAERKQAEEALDFERSQLLSIFDSIDDVVYVTDPYSYEVLYANKAMRERFGGDLVGGVCYREFQRKDSPCDFCTNSIILGEKGKPYRWEYYNPTVGRYFMITDRIIKWPDGRDVRFEIAKDITERRQAEEALLESEEKFKTIFDRVGMGIAIAEPRGYILDCNRAYQELLGYSKDDLREKRFVEFTHPDDVDRNLELQRQLADGLIDKYQIEKRYIRKDGRFIWVLLTASAIRNRDGSLKYNLAVAEDITEQRRAEEALRESEETYRFLVENSKDITWKIDLQGRWTFISGNAEKVTGNRADESVGKPIQDFLAPESYELVNEKLRRRLLGEEIPPYEVLIRNRDGHYTPFELLTAPIVDDDGKIVGVQGVGRDISYRKEAEEALCNSEAKFRTLFENAGAAIYIIDVETGAIVDCNSNAELLVGRTRDELMEMVVTQLHPPDDVEKYRGNYVGRARQGHVINNEGEALHRDGERIPVIINAAPIVIGGREVMMGVFLDITKRKRAEEELQDAKARAELYLDLMGHDINNMHQIALGYLELALNMPLDTRRDEVFEKPIEVLQRSAQLIKNVRKLQRISDGVFQTHDVDVCKMLIGVQREFGAVPGKTITLNLNGHDHCYVRANELLHDIFANLVSNAIKHTGNTAEITIDVDRVIDDGKPCYRVIVEDDGPGIPDDSKGRIFHRMLKGPTDAKGMGLGLYLVKSLVESNNGNVWVGDRVLGDHSKGARFVVMLPAADN